jgi:hypothetical protein
VLFYYYVTDTARNIYDTIIIINFYNRCKENPHLSPRMATAYLETQRWKAPHKVDRRSGEGRGKPLDEGSTRPRGELWGRPMSSSGRLSAEMMMQRSKYKSFNNTT